MRKQRKSVENIILINPLIYGLEDELEKEQESVIADTATPAEKIVKRLIEIDDRRIDLCNLNVLYGYIERWMGEKFGLLLSCVYGGTDCDLTDEAAKHLASVGYGAERVEREFGYLFKLIKRPPKKRNVKSVGESDSVPINVV